MATLRQGAAPVAVVVNPTSGKGRGARYAVPVAKALEDAGLSVRVLVGDDGVDAQRLARSAVDEGVAALVVVGGDGMVHIGVNAVAGTTTPLGIVAAGTGNDFARAVNLPLHDPDAATRTILDSPPRAVDAGRVGDEWFGCVLSAGFDSMVNERANQMTWPKGHSRYTLAMLLELGVFRAVPFRIEADDQVLETEAMLVAVGNAASYGGGMRVCPDARLDDGVFHVTVLRKVAKPEFLRVFPRVFKGTHVDHPAVDVLTARTVRLSAPGVVTYADGERVAPLPATVHCEPRALHLLAPPLA